MGSSETWRLDGDQEAIAGEAIASRAMVFR